MIGHVAPHRFAVPIEVTDIDFMGHVNNAAYLKWVQEAVLSHWPDIAPPEVVAAHLWVALQHDITYRRPTFLDDDVIIMVLLEKIRGARAFYHSIVRRGEEVLAEVRSSRCCIDAATRKPARLSVGVVGSFSSAAP